MERQKVAIEDLMQLVGELTVQLRLAQKTIEEQRQRIAFLEQRNEAKPDS